MGDERRRREKRVGAEVGEGRGNLKFSRALLPGNITHPPLRALTTSARLEARARVIPHLSPFSLKLPPLLLLYRASLLRAPRARSDRCATMRINLD